MEQINADKNIIYETYPFEIFYNNIMDSGCYYISPKDCKDIIINAGVSGIRTPNAIRKIKNLIYSNNNCIYSTLDFLNLELLRYYAGELAENLVIASAIGKGVEITTGYPKILNIQVN